MNAIVSAVPSLCNRFGVPSVAPSPRKRQVGLSQLLHLGNRLHKDGKLPEAERIFRRILAAQPDNPVALLSLGIITHQKGRSDLAVRFVRQAIEIAPTYYQAFNNLGNMLADTGQFDDAVSAFRRAIELSPDYAEAHFNLGATLRRQNRLDDAIEVLTRSKELSPRRAGVHFELGQCHQRLGNRLEAQIAYRVALSIEPGHVMARNHIGRMLSLMGRFTEAEDEFRRAIDVEPENVSVLNGLSEALKRMGRFEEALQMLERALPLEPCNVETLNNLASTHQSMGDVGKAAAFYGRVLELAPHAEFAEKSSLFVALNRPELSTDELFDLHRRLRSRHDRPDVRRKAFADRNRDPERKLRIGFVGSDFRTHVVALNILPLIANYDRSRFEVFLYSQEKTTDTMTQAFRELTDRYTAIDRYRDAEAAEVIEKDEVDILVVLAGRFDENRPLIATYRPAPVQVSFHDCATSGLEAMDYWLTDHILHPAGTVEKFTEQLYRLPVYYQYPIQEGLPDISPLPALSRGYITFGCFNKPEKINEQVISLWSAVLRAVPDSKLLLKYFNHYSEPTMRAHWIQRFAAHGIGEDQLVLKAATENRSRHLQHYHNVDIALDPFPFNGATTTFEALTMGVPVIALEGRHFVDRVATSMLAHVGLSELAAADRDGYVELAAALAADVGRLAELRGSLRDKLHASPLCDGPGYARSVEAAFRDMWRTWAATGATLGR